MTNNHHKLSTTTHPCADLLSYHPKWEAAAVWDPDPATIFFSPSSERILLSFSYSKYVFRFSINGYMFLVHSPRPHGGPFLTWINSFYRACLYETSKPPPQTLSMRGEGGVGWLVVVKLQRGAQKKHLCRFEWTLGSRWIESPPPNPPRSHLCTDNGFTDHRPYYKCIYIYVI